ncbi:MAG TPA: aromatic amino acid lyase, partial [Candidatus Polarisedimenticolaceae bacterium]|nr:aromatic amino acid lyase [Candidatus Polarisedimenticolaceae bacterium]
MIPLDGRHLRLEQVEAIADGARCTVPPPAWRRVEAARRVVVDALRGGEQVYGVNTGFGQLAQVRIDARRVLDLQRNLVRSHAAG